MATLFFFVTHDERVVPLLEKHALVQGKQMKEYLGCIELRTQEELAEYEVEQFTLKSFANGKQTLIKKNPEQLRKENQSLISRIRSLELPKISPRDLRRTIFFKGREMPYNSLNDLKYGQQNSMEAAPYRQRNPTRVEEAGNREDRRNGTNERKSGANSKDRKNTRRAGLKNRTGGVRQET